MNRKLAFSAALVAAFAFTCQAADAGGRKHIDKRIAAVAIGAGAASTVAILGMNDWKWRHWNNTRGITRLGAWGVTTAACAAVSPLVATVVLDRQLTQREGHILIGSCVIPLIGGWLVNEAYNANPSWEPGAKKAGMKHGKTMKAAKKKKM